MTTIYDVAKASGVSPKTVSRVINGDAAVGQLTRTKVESAILDLGYVPSSAARMMRLNRSGLIGLITGVISKNPVDARGLPGIGIVQGIQAALADTGLTLMIADTNGRADRVPDLLRTFLRHRVEGLLYVADYHQHVTMPSTPADCPLVLVNCFDDAGTPAVVPDDRECQRALVETMIAQGHRRIGFLTLAPGGIAADLRAKGYRDALAAANIPFDPALVFPAYAPDQQPDSAQLIVSLDRLLRLPQPPTAICCGKDSMAMAVYGVLRSRGVRVPEDMSIAGFDDYRVISETLFPPLTTVALPYHDMGKKAVECLRAAISGKPAPTENPISVAGPVAWRSSVAAVTPQ